MGRWFDPGTDAFPAQELFKALKYKVASCTYRIVVELVDTQDVVEGFRGMAGSSAALGDLAASASHAPRLGVE